MGRDPFHDEPAQALVCGDYYARFANKRPRQRAIKKMLQNRFKKEVEAMISKDFPYLTDE